MSEDRTPIRTKAWAPAGRALALLTALAVATAGAGPGRRDAAKAQDAALRGMPVIRDTPRSKRCCATMRSRFCAPPTCQAEVRVVVLGERTFNAFVMDGRHIFVNGRCAFDAKDAERESSACSRTKPATLPAAI